MEFNTVPEPEFESLKMLLVDMSQERSVNRLLEMIVNRLASRPTMALAQVWLIGESNECDHCSFKSQCGTEGECLHLVAMAGEADDGTSWSGPGGGMMRLPLSKGVIARIASSGKPQELLDIGKDYFTVMSHDTIRKGGGVGFVGQPVTYRGKVLGVLALYTTIPPRPEGILWARMIADHAASAIANARAFEEIERLQRKLQLENTLLREQVNEARDFGDIVAQSQPMLKVISQIDQVAPTNATVLILGESGTGKELVALEIFKRSRRKEGPFIKINCPAVPGELAESEFFGHVKGAFTGAVKDRAGRFEIADGGTLFLDEISEMPLDLQSKLLRVIQEGEYERVGEGHIRKVDVRIIAASNKNLSQEVDAGRFRKDLFYRLNVFPIHIHPLCSRITDIPLLADHFLKTLCKSMNRFPLKLSKHDVQQLQNYSWPGNVRELQNVLERAVITSTNNKLHFELPCSISETISDTSAFRSKDSYDKNIMTENELHNFIRNNILAALKQTKWRIYGEKGAASLLGIKPTTLAARIKKMDLKKHK
jgi:transcriptional regulator with GAF, ATPase, and Fis domain